MEQTNLDKSKKRKREEHITFIDELIEESINNKKNKKLLESTENELELETKNSLLEKENETNKELINKLEREIEHKQICIDQLMKYYITLN